MCEAGASALARALEVELALGGEALRERLVASLREAIAEPSGLAAVLAPVSSLREDGECLAGGDSLARVLLSCSGVRGGAAAALLERAAMMGDSPEELASCRSVLAQFRWLDGAVDGGSALLEKLLEVFELFPAPVQPEVCSFLPELVADDTQAEVVAGALLRKLEGDSAFVAPVVATLQEFQLGDEIRGRAAELAAEQVGAVEQRDLPGLARFVLQVVPPAQGPGVLRTLRRRLPFAVAPPSDPRRAAPDPKGKGPRAAAVEASPVLDAFRLALRCSSDARELIVRELRMVTVPADHTNLDFYLLLALHSLGGDSAKVALSTLTKKLAAGHAGTAWLDSAVRGHRSTLEEGYVPSLQAFAEVLLQGKEPLLHGFGEQLYVLIFVTFPGAQHRQAVLGALVGHCGEGPPAEALAALQALAELSREHCADLGKFGSFLIILLDHLTRFDRPQLYLVFGLFSDLVAEPYTCAPSAEQALQGRVEDEFYIVVRKQLSSSLAQHRRVGVIASISFAEHLLAAAGRSVSVDCRAHLEREAVAMLRQTLEQSRGRPGVLAFFCDEMASAVSSGSVRNRGLLSWLREQVEESFEGTFVGDQEDPATWGDGTAVDRGGRPWFNLDGAGNSSLTIRILSLAASAQESERHSLFSMCSQLRLLSAVVLAEKGNLEDIDALLGAPMQLVPNGWLQRFHDLLAEDQHLSCRVLFFACAWVLELINVYSSAVTSEQDPRAMSQASDPPHDFKNKLCFRLRNLGQLQVLLGECLRNLPDAHVPKMQELSGDPGEGVAAGISAHPAGAALQIVPHVSILPAFPAGKKRGQQTSSVAPEEAKVAGSAIVTFLKEKGCFRPLNASALTLLSVKTVPRNFCSCAREEALVPMKLGLLEELAQRAATLAATKRANLGRASLLARPVIGALPSLREHMALCVSVASTRLLDTGLQGSSACRHAESLSASGEPYPEVPDLDIAGDITQNTATAALRSSLLVLQSLRDLLRLCSKQSLRQSDFAAVLQGLSTVETGSNEIQAHLSSVLEWLRVLKQHFDSFNHRYLCVASMALLRECAANFKNLSTDAALQEDIRAEVAQSASDVLSGAWEDDGGDGAWKHRKAHLKLLILNNVRFSEDPLNVIGHYIQEGLALVSTNPKETASVPGIPSMSPATLEVWVAALLTETSVVFDGVTSTALRLAVQAPHAAVGSSAFQENVTGVLARAHGTIRLASNLCGLVKHHPGRRGLQKAAVRWGTALVLSFLKATDFLESQLVDHRDTVITIVRELQRVTKVLQVVAAESKTRKDLAIASRVPALKRALEKLVWRCKVMFKDGEEFWMGNLKHKNLQGDQVCSQAYEEEVYAEDGYDDEGDDEEEEEEEEAYPEDSEGLPEEAHGMAPASKAGDEEDDGTGDEGENMSI